MECDIIIEFGGSKRKFVITSNNETPNADDNDVKVVIEDPEVEIDSLEDVVKFIKSGKLEAADDRQLLKLLEESKPELSTKKLKNKLNNTVILDNCSFSKLKSLYPNEMSLLPNDKDREGYHISIINGARINGDSLYGRVIAHGQEHYIFRGADDVRDFVFTEIKKNKINQLVNENTIGEEEDRGSALKDRYEPKLLDIVNFIKGNKKISARIKEELGLEPTIQSVLIDFLNYYDEYKEDSSFKDLKHNDKVFDGFMVLRDFCSELTHEELYYYEESESELAQALRRNSIKRDRLGKKSLYETLVRFDPEFMANYSEKDFLKLNKEGMTELLNHFFQGDLLLQNFEVIDVKQSEELETKLTKTQVKKLFKQTKERKIKEASVETAPDKDLSYETAVDSISAAKEWIGTKYIDNKGDEYQLRIESDGKGGFNYWYRKAELSDKDFVRIKYKGHRLEELFDFANFGHRTFTALERVDKSNHPDAENIVDGKYKGYYIYFGQSLSGEKRYIITKSVVHPQYYIKGAFGSLKDAKNAILSINNSVKVGRSVMHELKFFNTIPTKEKPFYTKNKVRIGFNTSPGQTIDVIDYYLSPNVLNKLGSSEVDLFNDGKIHDIIDFYTNPSFGLIDAIKQKTINSLSEEEKEVYTKYSQEEIDQILKSYTEAVNDGSGKKPELTDDEKIIIGVLNKIEGATFWFKKMMERTLDTPEKAGTFLLAMADKGFYYRNGMTISQDELGIIESILNELKDPKYKQYVVRRSFQNRNDNDEKFDNEDESDVKYKSNIDSEIYGYTVYVQSLSDANIVVDSSGTYADGVDEQGNEIRRLPGHSITKTLYDLKEHFNKGLFKGTGIEVVITDNDSLLSDPELQDEEGKSIFGEDFNPKLVKGFVYGNKIYINQSNVTSGLNTLFHETLHIMFGMIKADDIKNGTNNYEIILSKFDETNRRFKSIVKQVDKLYHNMAYLDKKEEMVVRYMERQIENNSPLFYNESSVDAEKEISSRLMEVFGNAKKEMNSVIRYDYSNKEEKDNITFKTAFQAMFKGKDNDLLDRMSKQRIVTNLIEENIALGNITEDCK